jgi:hypothetical protein
MEFQTDLKASGYHLRALIINRCFPDWEFASQNADSKGNATALALREYYMLMRKQFEHRVRLADQLQSQISDIPVIRVPECRSSPQGLEDLFKLNDKLGDCQFLFAGSK